MSVAINSAVGSTQQGSYTPQVEQSTVAAPAPEMIRPVETAVQTAADTGEKEKEKQGSGEASEEAIRKAVDKINKHAMGTEAIFGIHDKTNRVTIKIVDKETKDVIKEVPAEETLDLIAKAWEMAGLLVDEKR